MRKRHESDPCPARIAGEAAAWVLRGDRGLSPAEQDEFSAWLAADPRHGEQLARHRRHWQRLDRLASWRPEHGAAPNADLLAPAPCRRFPSWVRLAVPFAAAAAVALVWILGTPAPSGPPAGAPPVADATAAAVTSHPLPDGTIVERNGGAVFSAAFTAAERRVVLEHGEAHFTVAKDPTRPFVVRAGGIEVRALGTAFNVRVAPGAVEVLVTEGRVGVERPPDGSAAAARPAEPSLQLTARQRAVVPRDAAVVESAQVDTLTPGEIERVLAWQHRLLDFNAAPLREVVAEFNRRNRLQLRVADPVLAEVRISAAFRSDNVEGFVRLLEAGFGARAERRGEAEIVLVSSR